jgi:predicted O-methyltransferase YrrM
MGALRTWTGAKVASFVATRPRLSHAVVVRVGPPRLIELYESAGSWSMTAEDALKEFAACDPAEARDLIAEARSALERVQRRATGVVLSYPANYRVEIETALFLYAVVRVARPRVAVETGVADGVSSALILAAMDANGHGELHSIDIARDVGALVADRSRWTLHVVDPADPRASAAVVGALPSVDLFLHDGNHEREYQAHEYRAAWNRLGDGGVLLTDDADWSYAFLEFTREHGVRPAMLMDRRKVFGALTKSVVMPDR